MREGVVAVYLFGSTARGTAKPDSDVDVAVLYTSPPPQPRIAFEVQTRNEAFDLEPVLTRYRTARKGRA